MGSLVIIYQHIADILSFETPNSKLKQSLSSRNFDWDTIVVEGSKHLVLPAIYCRLKSKQLLDLLPEELKNYLEQITAINRNRNKVLLKQINSISQLLNQNHIEHVFLKGAALLASRCYTDIAERMIGDIDLLISKIQLNDAFELLKNNGYDKTYGYAYKTIDFRHLDRLISHKELAAIELHSELLTKNHRHLIDINKMLASKLNIDGIAIPNNYYLSKHHILAWQINSMGYFYKSLSFKSFYDSIILTVYSNTTLISDLLKTKYGQAYLELGKCYFKEFETISSSKSMITYKASYQKTINNPLYNGVIKPLKYGYIYIKKRFNLILNNKYYRIHLLKKIFISKK